MENMTGKTKGKKEKLKQNTALYIRLSREDGDKAESLSVANQRMLLTEFVESQSDLHLYDVYIDDGYTGTSFARPGFQRMLEDIEAKKVACVIVKDLSRLGRNMPKVSEYVNEYFPDKKVRFIAVSDGIDRQYYDIDTGGAMMMDIKNMFNGFYPRDISQKVRSTFKTKQSNGQFIGAFACFGYKKSGSDHNKLEVDEYAAEIVRRIFSMYLDGCGQNTIARRLNDEGIPCPAEYKKRCGLNYHNGNQLSETFYWTYSTVRRILQNEMYIGNMVQNKSFRQVCKKNAVSLPRDKWIVVENTHRPIIDKLTWEQVQNLLKRNARQTGLDGNMHLFAGFLKCGDCGRAMVKVSRKGTACFHCGSYNRYGKKICTIHKITEWELNKILLDDLNLLIKSVKDIKQLVEEEQKRQKINPHLSPARLTEYQLEIDRLTKKKERAYEDYSDGVISREDYLKYKGKYENQILAVQLKIDLLHKEKEGQKAEPNTWIEKLLAYERISYLDREIVAEMISAIYVYENKVVRIVYKFSEEPEVS